MGLAFFYRIILSLLPGTRMANAIFLDSTLQMSNSTIESLVLVMRVESYKSMNLICKSFPMIGFWFYETVIYLKISSGQGFHKRISQPFAVKTYYHPSRVFSVMVWIQFYNHVIPSGLRQITPYIFLF